MKILKPVLILLTTALFLTGCSSEDNTLSQTLEDIKVASDLAKNLENGKYTHSINQYHSEYVEEVVTEGLFVRKEEGNFDWYTSILLGDLSDMSRTKSEALQRDGVKYQRIGYADENSEYLNGTPQWQVRKEDSLDEPTNLFFGTHNFPHYADIEGIDQRSDDTGIYHRVIMNDSYMDKLEKEGVINAEIALSKAKKDPTLSDTVPSMEENVERLKNTKYNFIELTYFIDANNILTRFRYSADMEVPAEYGTENIYYESETDIVDYNNPDIPNHLPTLEPAQTTE